MSAKDSKHISESAGDTFEKVINTPDDLRKLSIDELPAVCDSLRKEIVACLSQNPGHFASSMGAVEIAVALHYVYNTPEDKIVWDVGHQAYAHKLLTGRRDKFHTLRKKDGLSGFPNPEESRYDSFIAGHASNSISAGLGMAIADLITPGLENRRTVAVIGDASISGGLAFEGLNNASNHKNNLLIILNDNDMSIDSPVGSLHRYLSRLTTSAGYNRFRHRTYNFLRKHKLFSDKNRGRLIRFNNSIKSLISRRQNIFEGLNIRYFGPFDGHDVKNIVKVLTEIKDMQGPRILHLCTVKGKGYEVAEKNPTIWHAPGKFNPETGVRSDEGEKSDGIPKWQDVFGYTLVELARDHNEIVGISAAMLSGTSMNLMQKNFPDRTFDVGISEGHAVTFAGGLAAEGKHPFIAIYSSFLQRAYDSIIHDIAIQGLPVTFCIDRAGLVGDDGVTHHGLFDLAYLNVIPGIKIASPLDETTLRNLMFTSLDIKSPVAIRYPRGKANTKDWHTEFSTIPVGKGRELRHATQPKIAVLSIGPIGNNVTQALKLLEDNVKYVSHYDMIWLKPIDEELLRKVAEEHEVIITIEDGSINGALGSTVCDRLNSMGINRRIIKLGTPADSWMPHATVSELHKMCGIDAESINKTILKFL